MRILMCTGIVLLLGLSCLAQEQVQDTMRAEYPAAVIANAERISR